MQDQNQASKQQQRIGRIMIYLMWFLVLGLLTFFFQRYLDKAHNPNQALSTKVLDAGTREVILTRNRYGHYVTSGQINGSDVVFMLDTGASDISVPEHIALELKLKRGSRAYYNTANGVIMNYMTRLDEVAIGGIVLQDVSASINPASDSDDILLGMSFLRQLEFAQRGDKLILRQYPTATE